MFPVVVVGGSREGAERRRRDACTGAREGMVGVAVVDVVMELFG